jgi:hypothetical protein
MSEQQTVIDPACEGNQKQEIMDESDFAWKTA